MWERCRNVSADMVRKEKVEKDPRLKAEGLNKAGRYLPIKSNKSKHIVNPEWEPPPDMNSRSWILETGCGGLEIATFNEKTEQDLHKHEIATEIYTVLRGEMEIKVAGEHLFLSEGDGVVVLPGTLHEVIRKGNFLTRVHTVNCHGDEYKYAVLDQT